MGHKQMERKHGDVSRTSFCHSLVPEPDSGLTLVLAASSDVFHLRIDSNQSHLADVSGLGFVLFVVFQYDFFNYSPKLYSYLHFVHCTLQPLSLQDLYPVLSYLEIQISQVHLVFQILLRNETETTEFESDLFHMILILYKKMLYKYMYCMNRC